MSAIIDHHDVATSPTPGNRARSGARAIDLIWLTWRQHRSAITASVVLACVLTGSMVYVGDRIAAINGQCGNAVCPPNSAQFEALASQFGLLALASDLEIAVIIMPLLIGVFLGAPLLAREHEQRTLLLAWSQDVSPQRWLRSKLALLGGLTAALAGAVSVAGDHLAHVYAVAADRSLFSWPPFLVTGMVPLVLTFVWFAVSVALGAAFRRTLPAVFTSVAAFFGLFFLVQWRYPTFVTPLITGVHVGDVQPGRGPLDLNALRVSSTGHFVDAAGHPVSTANLSALCPSPEGPQTLEGQCLNEHNVYLAVNYQPGSRIPEFHLILDAGYLGLGIIALAAIWWLVRRTNLSAG